jgi:DNA-binding transcriptional ArsR family regulator
MVKNANKKIDLTAKARNPARLPRHSLEKMALIFGAFADATRLGILQELRAGRQSVGALVELLGTSQANISKHLKQLHSAGLVIREREKTQVFYRVEEEAVYEMCKYACKRLNDNASAHAVRADDYFI